MMKRGDTLTMNDFKIIKCKKCDAPLVEMKGEKLDRCIQCEHIFNPGKITKVAHKKQITTHSNTLKATPLVSQLIRKLRKMADEKTLGIPAKKKFSMMTVIKWYLIIIFVSGILSSIFSHE